MLKESQSMTIQNNRNAASEAKQNIERWNRRIPIALEREQATLPKKVRKHKVSFLEGLQQVFEILDRYADTARGCVACRPGCSYCCHGEIAISSLEAMLISQASGRLAKTPSPSTGYRTKPSVESNRPCPLLGADGLCSVYEARPMVCRTHVNFASSNEACKFDADPNGTIYMINRATSFPGAMRAWNELNQRAGAVLIDIREFFG